MSPGLTTSPSEQVRANRGIKGQHAVIFFARSGSAQSCAVCHRAPAHRLHAFEKSTHLPAFRYFGGNVAVEFFVPDYAEQFVPGGRSVLSGWIG
jgi:hypothetical protein